MTEHSRWRTLLLVGFVLLAAGGMPVPAEGETTEIREPSFKLSLPGSWQAVARSEAGFYQYRQDGTRAQVSVSLAFSEPAAPRDELAQLFTDFEASRRKAVLTQAPSCEISATVKREHLDAISGSYLGACGAGGPRIGDLMIVRSDLVASFLLEAYALSEQAFRELFQEIVSGAGLAHADARGD